MQVQSILFPLVVATEVYQWLDYESLVLVVRATRSVRQVYEPVALQMVKHLVKVAAGRVGSMRARLHHTSLVHSLVRNLWKLWRRSVALLEECLVSVTMARGGVYFTLETAKDRLWQPRGDWVPPEHRADVQWLHIEVRNFFGWLLMLLVEGGNRQYRRRLCFWQPASVVSAGILN